MKFFNFSEKAKKRIKVGTAVGTAILGVVLVVFGFNSKSKNSEEDSNDQEDTENETVDNNNDEDNEIKITEF